MKVKILRFMRNGKITYHMVKGDGFIIDAFKERWLHELMLKKGYLDSLPDSMISAIGGYSSGYMSGTTWNALIQTAITHFDAKKVE